MLTIIFSITSPVELEFLFQKVIFILL